MFTEIRWCYRRLETLQKRESVTEECRFERDLKMLEIPICCRQLKMF